MYNIPILFIIFKRKDVALKSFESIRKIQPKKLYVAGDGPRSYIQGEAKKVEGYSAGYFESGRLGL